MIRRLKKVTSQAELQQLIEAGIIASPYIAFDSSSNVTNMVLPAEREISEIEYEQEVSSPVKLVGPVNIEYYTQEGYTAGTLSFTANAEQTDKSMITVVACQKTHFDEVCLRDPKTPREEMIAQLIVDTLKYVPGVEDMERFSPVHCFGTSWSLPQNEEDEGYEKGVLRAPLYPWGEDVIYTVNNENLAGDDLIWVPYDSAYPDDNTYYIFAGYYSAGVQGPSDIANACQLAQYRVMPYLSDSSTFVYDGMDLVAYEKLDPDTGESMGQYRNFEARVPGNTLYDRARYAWYLDGESDTEALENGRTAVCDATTTFSFSDMNAPEYINDTDQTLEGFIAVQLYNSVTGAESKVKNFSTMYVEPSDEGDDTPDSSVDSSTSEGPTLTFSSTDLTYNTVADFVPVISGDDSYYDSVAFFVIPDSMIADTLSDNPDWTMADAVWSLVENEDTRSVGLDSSSGDTVDLLGILNTYYDNQEVYVVALLEHYEVGEYPVYYQPDDEAGNYAYETFAWGEPAEPEPEEPEPER